MMYIGYYTISNTSGIGIIAVNDGIVSYKLVGMWGASRKCNAKIRYNSKGAYFKPFGRTIYFDKVMRC